MDEVTNDRLIDGVKQYLVKFVGYHAPEWTEAQDNFKDAVRRYEGKGGEVM